MTQNVREHKIYILNYLLYKTCIRNDTLFYIYIKKIYKVDKDKVVNKLLTFKLALK